MTALNEELLFALRGVQAQNLALLVCALDEAMRDPNFDAAQARMIVGLLQRGQVPATVRQAAEQRLDHAAPAQADDDFADVLAWIAQTERTPPSRPLLTLVGNAAA